VPRMPFPDHAYNDTITVTHSIDCLRAGFDPYQTGRREPWNRMLNYPPVWLELRSLGVSSEITLVLGISMAALTALALLLILRTQSQPSFMIVLLATLSPAILFGIERGNVDTLLFSILVFGLFATRNLSGPTKQALRSALMVGLTILKAYPIAACSIFLDVHNEAGLRRQRLVLSPLQPSHGHPGTRSRLSSPTPLSPRFTPSVRHRCS